VELKKRNLLQNFQAVIFHRIKVIKYFRSTTVVCSVWHVTTWNFMLYFLLGDFYITIKVFFSPVVDKILLDGHQLRQLVDSLLFTLTSHLHAFFKAALVFLRKSYMFVIT